MKSKHICEKANHALIWGMSCILCGVLSCIAFIPEWQSDGMAFLSLIGLIGLLIPICSMTAIILGIGALVQIGKSRGHLRGNGRAIASIVLGAIWFYLILAAIIFPFFATAREKACAPEYLKSRQRIAMVEKSFVPLLLSLP